MTWHHIGRGHNIWVLNPYVLPNDWLHRMRWKNVNLKIHLRFAPRQGSGPCSLCWSKLQFHLSLFKYTFIFAGILRYVGVALIHFTIFTQAFRCKSNFATEAHLVGNYWCKKRKKKVIDLPMVKNALMFFVYINLIYVCYVVWAHSLYSWNASMYTSLYFLFQKCIVNILYLSFKAHIEHLKSDNLNQSLW